MGDAALFELMFVDSEHAHLCVKCRDRTPSREKQLQRGPNELLPSHLPNNGDCVEIDYRSERFIQLGQQFKHFEMSADRFRDFKDDWALPQKSRLIHTGASARCKSALENLRTVSTVIIYFTNPLDKVRSVGGCKGWYAACPS